VVKITESLQDAKRWQVGHGGWNEAMAGVGFPIIVYCLLLLIYIVLDRPTLNV